MEKHANSEHLANLAQCFHVLVSDGDKAVIDRSKKPKLGDIILAVIDGEFTSKTLSKKKNGNAVLLPANSTGAYSPIEIKEGISFYVWGVVTGSFRRFGR
jgi:DNA polymerase V